MYSSDSDESGIEDGDNFKSFLDYEDFDDDILVLIYHILYIYIYLSLSSLIYAYMHVCLNLLTVQFQEPVKGVSPTTSSNLNTPNSVWMWNGRWCS